MYISSNQAVFINAPDGVILRSPSSGISLNASDQIDLSSYNLNINTSNTIAINSYEQIDINSGNPINLNSTHSINLITSMGAKANYNGYEIATVNQLQSKDMASTTEQATGQTFNNAPLYTRTFVISNVEAYQESFFSVPNAAFILIDFTFTYLVGPSGEIYQGGTIMDFGSYQLQEGLGFYTYNNDVGNGHVGYQSTIPGTLYLKVIYTK